MKLLNQFAIFGTAIFTLLSAPLLSGAAPETAETTQDKLTISDIHRWKTESSRHQGSARTTKVLQATADFLVITLKALQLRSRQPLSGEFDSRA